MILSVQLIRVAEWRVVEVYCWNHIGFNWVAGRDSEEPSPSKCWLLSAHGAF